MDSLFGAPLTSILIGLLVLVAVAMGSIAWIAWRQPILFRMGLRNLVRRKAQTALIIIGLMLSTLIISAAFATGDTVGYSITNEVYKSLEDVDFVIAYDRENAPTTDGAPTHLTDRTVQDLQAAFANDPDIDGITGILVRTLPVLNPQRRLSEPAAQVVGVNPASVDSFHALRTLDGEAISAATLNRTDAYITDRLAKAIEAKTGDTILIVVNNQPRDFTVLGIVRDTSITGAGGDLLIGGVVLHLDTARSLDGDPDEVTFIGVSSKGGVRDALPLSDTVEDKLTTYLENTPGVSASVDFTKKDQVELAELVGSIFVTFFLIFGLFSIAAGIMLIFLIFIMLAAERRTEMGMARAIGMKRLHLTQMFLAEGSGYNVMAAAVGAILGTAVAYALIRVLNLISSEFGFSITFHVNPQGLLIALSLGIVLTFATIAFSSFHTANLNIVRAIRDIPDPQPLRGHDRRAGELGKAMIGALWTLAWIAIVAIWVTAGVALFIISLSTYGLGVLALLLLGAWFIYGLRTLNRPFRPLRLRSKTLFILWIIAFNVLALLTWSLTRSRGWASRHRNAGGWAMWMLTLGLVGIYMGGWVWGQAAPYTGGVTLLLLALAMLAVYFGATPRLSFTVAGLALIWYWLTPLPFNLFTGATSTDTDPVRLLVRLLQLPEGKLDNLRGDIEMFFVSGIAITAASTLTVIFNASALQSLVSLSSRFLGRLTPAVKTAIAYPLAQRFRTGMTLAMFALVVFSLIVMSFLNHNFTQLFTSENSTGGFDVVVSGNPSNPIGDLPATLRAAGYDVAAPTTGVGTMRSLFPDIVEDAAPRPADATTTAYQLAEVDARFLDLARLPTAHRARGYASDEAVLQALRTDPTVAIAPHNVISADEGFGGDDQDPFTVQGAAILRDEEWDPIAVTVRDAATGRSLQFRIIAFLEPEVTGTIFQLNAIYTHNINLTALSEDGRVLENYFIVTKDQSDEAARSVAQDIESALLERGVQAQSIRELIDQQARISRQFQYLFQGFMSLGLVVGIAALGVIALRTVVERKRQIGIMRAIGYTRRLVALSFFLESSFIALTGIIIGVVMGTALSYNLLTDPAFTEGANVQFQVPWFQLILIVTVAYGASALMTLLPARSASRVTIVEALRYE